MTSWLLKYDSYKNTYVSFARNRSQNVKKNEMIKRSHPKADSIPEQVAEFPGQKPINVVINYVFRSNFTYYILRGQISTFPFYR